MRWALAVGLVVNVAVACSSFDSEETATPSDAGPEAAIEASSDAGGPADSATDAPAVGDGSCSGVEHLLCEEFKGDAFPSPQWDGRDEALPGAFTVSTEKSVSAPQSLLVTVAGDSGSSLGHAVLKKNVASQLRKLNCAFSIYPESLTTNGADGAFVFQLNLTGNAASGISVAVFALGFRVDGTLLRHTSYPADGGSATQEGSSALALSLGQWQRLGLVLDLDASTIVVTLGAATLTSYTFSTALPSHNGGVLALGISGVSTDTRFFLDDIVCDQN